MTIKSYMSSFIRRLAISLLLLVVATSAQAQLKFFTLQKDSIPLFRGFAVSFDMVGAGMVMLSDYGQYEAALRVNLHDEWFPIVEAGIGKANHDDEVTFLHYNTSAPYFKIGIDKNMLKDKHGPNRLYVGLRYGFTSYKIDISRPDYQDPVWQWDTSYSMTDVACKYHWAEIVVGVDAKIFGPLHLVGLCATSSVCLIPRRENGVHRGMCRASVLTIRSWAPPFTSSLIFERHG